MIERKNTLPPRRFQLIRNEDISGVSGTGVVAFGVMFGDGAVALRWNSAAASTAVFASLSDLEAVHGHEGCTQVEWIDEE